MRGASGVVGTDKGRRKLDLGRQGARKVEQGAQKVESWQTRGAESRIWTDKVCRKSNQGAQKVDFGQTRGAESRIRADKGLTCVGEKGQGRSRVPERRRSMLAIDVRQSP